MKKFPQIQERRSTSWGILWKNIVTGIVQYSWAVSVCSTDNGGAALLCQPGELLIIYACEESDRAKVLRSGHQARVMVADEHNRPQQFFYQTLQPSGDCLRFCSSRLLTVRTVQIQIPR